MKTEPYVTREIDGAVWVRMDADEPHVIQLVDRAWTLRHPLRCRVEGTLFSCDVNQAARVYSWRGAPADGYYAVTAEAGVLFFGDQL